MKRVTVLLLIISLILVFSASCGKEENNEAPAAKKYRSAYELRELKEPTFVQVSGALWVRSKDGGYDFYCYTELGGCIDDGFRFVPLLGTLDYDDLPKNWSIVTVTGLCVPTANERGKKDCIVLLAVVEEGKNR